MAQINRITRRNDPDSNNGRIFLHGTFIGFVKDNTDPQMMGRLQVYIPEIGGDPANPKDWITVSYATPFGGATSITKNSKSDQTMAGSQTSYGFWAVPPDLDNQVLVTFVNGDTARGFWYACIFQQNMNQMIPGIAAGSTADPNFKSQGNVPVVEYNKRLDSVNVDNPQRPVFTPLANGIQTQGLQTDTQRGYANSSARRDSVSGVYGLNTPRGHQMYVDDNTNNEFIRIRTRSGVQVLINDTTGFVYINSKMGNSWMELSDDGVEIYSKNSVSLRAEQDFNLRADRNIILDAGGSIYFRAVTDINMQADGQIVGSAGSKIVLSSESDTNLTVTGDFLTSVTGNTRNQTGADHTTKVTGNTRNQTGGDNTMNVTGAITRQGATINDNPGSAPSAPAVTAMPAQVPKPTSAPDIQNGQKATVMTIVNVLPTHEPWQGHPSGPQSSPSPNAANAITTTGGAGTPTTPSAANTVGQAGATVPTTVTTASGGTTRIANATAQQLISQYKGTHVGGGECTDLVKAATGLGRAGGWQQGQTLTPDSINDLQVGTPIALFENGKYNSYGPSSPNYGMSHAAIFLGTTTTSDGSPAIQVLDQGGGYPANVHTYAFGTPGGKATNGQYLWNASNYSVIKQ